MTVPIRFHRSSGRSKPIATTFAFQTLPVTPKVVILGGFSGQRWPKGAILGAIRVNGATSIPKGDTKLQEGALITIFALSKDIPEIESMLQVGMDFF